jgi:signal transduction histidine kinase
MNEVILDGVSDSIVLYGLDAKILYANRAAGDLAHTRAEQLKGKRPEDLAVSPRHWAPPSAIRQVARTRKAECLEHATEDGRLWSLELHPVLDEQGVVECVAEIRREIDTASALAKRFRALRKLFSSLLDFQESERRTIAGQLDVLTQYMSAIKLGIESACEHLLQRQVPEAIGILERNVPLMQQAIEESKELEMELYPSQLEELGLIPTLKWLFRRLRNRYPSAGIALRTEISENNIPEAYKVHIYRVFQELTRNIVQQPSFESITVKLRRRKEHIELMVKEERAGPSSSGDTGNGSSPPAFDVEIARKRLELVNGSLKIDSSRTSGRTFHAFWPV